LNGTAELSSKDFQWKQTGWEGWFSDKFCGPAESHCDHVSWEEVYQIAEAAFS